MIGLVKYHFKRCISSKKLRLEELNKIIVEIESVVNLKLITYISHGIFKNLPLRTVDFLNSLTRFCTSALTW